MATPTVDVAFITQYESDAHVAFQRTATKIFPTVRQANSVPPGEKAVFQIYGTGEAGVKARHGDVPIINPDHTAVELDLIDRYAGTYVDNLDLLKLNINERQLAAQATANACGRVADSEMITTMSAARTAGNTSGGTFTAANAKVEMDLLWKTFEDRYIPDDGQRYLLLSPGQWNKMEGTLTAPHDTFINKDFIGEGEATYTGSFLPMKRHKTFNVYTSPLNTTGYTVAYHSSAFGAATGQGVRVTPSWENAKQSWLFVASVSLGTVSIDKNGTWYALEA